MTTGAVILFFIASVVVVFFIIIKIIHFGMKLGQLILSVGLAIFLFSVAADSAPRNTEPDPVIIIQQQIERMKQEVQRLKEEMDKLEELIDQYRKGSLKSA